MWLFTLCIFSASLFTEGGGGYAHIGICIGNQSVNVVVQGYVQWGQGVNFWRFMLDSLSTKRKGVISRSTSSVQCISMSIL